MAAASAADAADAADAAVGIGNGDCPGPGQLESSEGKLWQGSEKGQHFNKVLV